MDYIDQNQKICRLLCVSHEMPMTQLSLEPFTCGTHVCFIQTALSAE